MCVTYQEQSAVLNKFEKIFPTHCLPLQPRLCLLRGSSGLACNSNVAFYKQCTTWTHHWHFTMYIQRMCNIFSIWQHCSFPIALWPFASNLKDIINIMAPSEGKCSKLTNNCKKNYQSPTQSKLWLCDLRPVGYGKVAVENFVENLENVWVTQFVEVKIIISPKAGKNILF